MSPGPDGLDPRTVLRRERAIRISIDSDETVRVVKHGGTIACGPRGLAILDAFSQPRSMEDALKALDAHIHGMQDWIDVTNGIVALHRGGVLRDARAVDEASPASDGTFADPMTHAMMLNDRTRTSTFVTGVERVVRPGDVVLDIGTGTGVLALAAARAGARQVYAVEATGMAAVARRVIEANGASDRITVVDGWSTEIDLPERADVLVGEIIGEMPLEEHVLETTLDARRRLLRPDARMMPRRLRILGLPIAIGADELATRRIARSTIEDWQTWYGIDFSPMLDAGQAQSHLVFADRASAGRFPAVAEPVDLADIDLTSFETLHVSTETVAVASTRCSLNGIVVYFDLELADGVSLSSDPRVPDPRTSWRNAVWFFNEALDVEPGDRVAVGFSYRAPGVRNGLRISRA